MADIWTQVLSIEQVSVHDNFFEVGGHSLLAIQILSRLHKVFQVQLPLKDLLDHATVAGLSHFLIVHQTKAGQIEKIAQVLKHIKSMSNQEREEILNKKRREKGEK